MLGITATDIVIYLDNVSGVLKWLVVPINLILGVLMCVKTYKEIKKK